MNSDNILNENNERNNSDDNINNNNINNTKKSKSNIRNKKDNNYRNNYYKNHNGINNNNNLQNFKEDIASTSISKNNNGNDNSSMNVINNEVKSNGEQRSNHGKNNRNYNNGSHTKYQNGRKYNNNNEKESTNDDNFNQNTDSGSDINIKNKYNKNQRNRPKHKYKKFDNSSINNGNSSNEQENNVNEPENMNDKGKYPRSANQKYSNKNYNQYHNHNHSSSKSDNDDEKQKKNYQRKSAAYFRKPKNFGKLTVENTEENGEEEKNNKKNNNNNNNQKQKEQNDENDNNLVKPKNNNYKNKHPNKLTNLEKVEIIKSNIHSSSEQDLQSTLIIELTNSTYECMVCYNIVKPKDYVWSCDTCYTVFHLNCIKKWANSDISSIGKEGAWRCPGCQSAVSKMPEKYTCFCGKVEKPKFNPYITPHTCSNICGKKRNCTHTCVEACHPGPCPPCTLFAPEEHCYCGKKTYTYRCSDLQKNTKSILMQKMCGEVCGRKLNCNVHTCKELCHPGECKECNEIVTESCYCGKEKRDFECGKNHRFSCKSPCSYVYPCKIHKCEKNCHPQSEHSAVCPFDPSVYTHCPCGEKLVVELLGGKNRKKCTDELVFCDGPCKKILPCGHQCKKTCHIGPCPTCDLRVSVPCRCKASTFEIPCNELSLDSSEELKLPLCGKKCNTLLNCGRHRCSNICCPARDMPAESVEAFQNHKCPLICKKPLNCGNHVCEAPCHRGPCNRCIIATFDDLICNCGKTRMTAPIPCGTTHVECSFPCIREKPCGHPQFSVHNCHGDDVPCPPCVVLTERRCACGGSIIKNIPCYRNQPCYDNVPVSCGKVCTKRRQDCGHKCNRICHSGKCEDEKCKERCDAVKKSCIHKCKEICHLGTKCPEDKPCTEMVIAMCKCGNKSKEMMCGATLASPRHSAHIQLPCDESCIVIERNRRLAEALGVSVETVSDSKCTYPEGLMEFTRNNYTWVCELEKKLEKFINNPEEDILKLPKMKPTHTIFYGKYAKYYYNFVVTYLDYPPNQTISIEKSHLTQIPSCLISKYIHQPQSTTINTASLSASSSSTSVNDIYNKMYYSGNTSTKASVNTKSISNKPINAILMTEIKHGLTTNDLETLLYPIFGSTLSFSVDWINNDADAIIMINHMNKISGSNTIVSQKIPLDELEEILYESQIRIEEKFVGNEWASEVKCCWVNSDMNIIESENSSNSNSMEKISNVRSKKLAPKKAAILPDKNIWDLLDEKEDTKKEEDPWDEEVKVSTNESNVTSAMKNITMEIPENWDDSENEDIEEEINKEEENKKKEKGKQTNTTDEFTPSTSFQEEKPNKLLNNDNVVDDWTLLLDDD